MFATLAKKPPRPADDAPHLLLVDDDRRIRDLLSRFLASEGYRVTTAKDAADARAKLLGLHFDLLILDVMMPGETGFDLARSIRLDSAVPIVMLTARHEPESRIEGLQIGADDYVAKPFEPRELLLRIGNILKRSMPVAAPQLEQVSVRALRLSSGARRTAPGRGDRASHRSRTRHAADPRRHARRDRAARRLTGGEHRQRARGRRADQPAAPQDRAGPRQSAVPAGGARHRLSSRRRAVADEHPRHRPERDPDRDTARGQGPRLRLAAVQRLHAEGAVRPRAADHDRADGDPAVGGRLRVHGAALEHGDAAAVAGGGAGHRVADRRLQGLSAGQGPRAVAPDRAGTARAGGGFPQPRRHAAARPKTVLLAARPVDLQADRPADRPAVLDRHRRPLQSGGNPHPARRRRDADLRAAQRRLRLEFGNLPVLDGRHLADPADRRGAVPAQPDPADPAAGGCRGKFRQGPRGAEFPPARRPRGAARGLCLHRDEGRASSARWSSAPRCWPASATICAPSSPASSSSSR